MERDRKPVPQQLSSPDSDRVLFFSSKRSTGSGKVQRTSWRARARTGGSEWARAEAGAGACGVGPRAGGGHRREHSIWPELGMEVREGKGRTAQLGSRPWVVL